jgi:hypothetical protein
MPIGGPPGPVVTAGIPAIGHQACGDTFHAPSGQCMTRVPLSCHKGRDVHTFDMAGVLREVKKVVSAVFYRQKHGIAHFFYVPRFGDQHLAYYARPIEGGTVRLARANRGLPNRGLRSVRD